MANFWVSTPKAVAKTDIWPHDYAALLITDGTDEELLEFARTYVKVDESQFRHGTFHNHVLLNVSQQTLAQDEEAEELDDYDFRAKVVELMHNARLKV